MIFVNSLGQKSLWLTHQQVEHHGGNVDNHPRLGGIVLMTNVDQVEDCKGERDQTWVGLWIMRRWRLMFERLFGLIIGKIKLTWACV